MIKAKGLIAALAVAGQLSCLPVGAVIPDAVHPDFELREIAMADKYKTMGLAFLNDGRLALASIDVVGMGEIPDTNSNHKILLVSGVNAGDTGQIAVREVANGWHQLAGLTVAGDKLYASDRDGFYEIEDLQNPANLKANRRLIVKWPDENHWSHGLSWHQWVFTPQYWQGAFYAPYSGSILPGGWSNTDPTTRFSGGFLKWDLAGNLEALAGGLRSPNGANINPGTGEMFVTDNQGSWLPASTFMKIKPGKFYGHRQTSPDLDLFGNVIGTHPANFAESLPYEPPVAWLPHGVVRSSPSQPVMIPANANTGFAGDWLIGDVNNPGLIRVALDAVGDTYNGAVLFFTNGLGNAAVNRLAFGPDGGLIIGTMMRIAGNWPGGDKSSLFKLTAKNPATAFDVKSIRSLADGVEIELTQPVNPDSAGREHFAVKQWAYVRQKEYGMGKQDDEPRVVAYTEISKDRKRIHLKIDSLKTDRVTYFRLIGLVSSGGQAVWNNEAWFTLNAQSARVWNAETPVEAVRGSGHPSWENRLRVTAPGGGILHVTLGAAGSGDRGRFTASLHALDGTRIDTQAGAGSETLRLRRLGFGPGLYLLRVEKESGDGQPGNFGATPAPTREFLSRKIFF